MVEITAMEQIKEKGMKRNEDSLRDHRDNIKCTHIRITVVPDREEREKGPEKISEEIIVQNFTNMGNYYSSIITVVTQFVPFCFPFYASV